MTFIMDIIFIDFIYFSIKKFKCWFTLEFKYKIYHQSTLYLEKFAMC